MENLEFSPQRTVMSFRRYLLNTVLPIICYGGIVGSLVGVIVWAYNFAAEKISETTKVSCAEIYGVVTFYSQFRLKPKAKHSISICTGTACFVLGAGVICDPLEKRLGIGDGGITEDGFVELHYVRCLGCCGLAPVVSIDGNIYSAVTPLSINKLVDKLYAEVRE